MKFNLVGTACALSLAMGVIAPNTASAITYNIWWAGSNGYTLTGQFSYNDIFIGTQGSAYHFCQLVDGVRNICTNVDDLVDCLWKVDTAGYMRGHIVNVAECPGLFTIAENSQGFTLHDLVHEDANHIAVAVTDILIFAINIVRPEDDVIQAKELMRTLQIIFYRQLADTIRIFGHRGHIFQHGQPINRMVI